MKINVTKPKPEPVKVTLEITVKEAAFVAGVLRRIDNRPVDMSIYFPLFRELRDDPEFTKMEQETYKNTTFSPAPKY